jgi:hypothetical protein
MTRTIPLLAATLLLAACNQEPGQRADGEAAPIIDSTQAAPPGPGEAPMEGAPAPVAPPLPADSTAADSSTHDSAAHPPAS